MKSERTFECKRGWLATTSSNKARWIGQMSLRIKELFKDVAIFIIYSMVIGLNFYIYVVYKIKCLGSVTRQ